MMNFSNNSEIKESKVFELKSKYKSFLNNLNSSPLFDKLSYLDSSKLNPNKRINFLISENLQVQNNIELLQRKINEKLNSLELNGNGNHVDNSNDLFIEKDQSNYLYNLDETANPHNLDESIKFSNEDGVANSHNHDESIKFNNENKTANLYNDDIVILKNEILSLTKKFSKLELQNNISHEKNLDNISSEKAKTTNLYNDDIDVLKNEILLLTEKFNKLEAQDDYIKYSASNDIDILPDSYIESYSQFKETPYQEHDIKFLKSEIVSINNILSQINNDINKKLDFSIVELTSLYENVKIEMENLSNQEFTISTPPSLAKDISDEIVKSLNESIKDELISFRDNFDKKLDDLKNHFEFQTHIKERDSNPNSSIDNTNDMFNNYQEIDNNLYTDQKKKDDNHFETFRNNQTNFDAKDLESLFFIQEEDTNTEPLLEESPLKINSEFASIKSIEKKDSNLNQDFDLNKIIDNTPKNSSNDFSEKDKKIIAFEIESKWTSVVYNMEQNIKIITDENQFLKSKFDHLKKKYNDLKKEFIKKNYEANNVEKILTLTNHKFNELSKIIDQQDMMMKTLQEENKLFFNNFKYNKNDIKNTDNLLEDINEINPSILVSSNLKKLEEKLINIQYELNKIDRDDFDKLINEYGNKIV